MARHEMAVAKLLSVFDYQYFVPTYQSRRRWSDRYKTVEAPLFPGYIFCRIEKGIVGGILRTPGVIRVVGFNRTISQISDAEVSALQQMTASGREINPVEYFNLGSKVRVTKGPLLGLVGILISRHNRYELVLSVELLMKSASVIVDASEVEEVRENKTERMLDSRPFHHGTYSIADSKEQFIPTFS
jgi:transcription antitermination factor NusG